MLGVVTYLPARHTGKHFRVDPDCAFRLPCAVLLSLNSPQVVTAGGLLTQSKSSKRSSSSSPPPPGGLLLVSTVSLRLSSPAKAELGACICICMRQIVQNHHTCSTTLQQVQDEIVASSPARSSKKGSRGNQRAQKQACRRGCMWRSALHGQGNRPTGVLLAAGLLPGLPNSSSSSRLSRSAEAPFAIAFVQLLLLTGLSFGGEL